MLAREHRRHCIGSKDWRQIEMRIRYNCVQLRREALTLCSDCWYNDKEKFKKHHSAFCFWGQGGVNTRPQGTGVGHQRCVSTGSSDSPGGSVLNHQQVDLEGQLWETAIQMPEAPWPKSDNGWFPDWHHESGAAEKPTATMRCTDLGTKKETQFLLRVINIAALSERSSVFSVFCLLYQSVQTWARVRKDLKPYLLHLKYLNLCVDFQLRVTAQIN